MIFFYCLFCRNTVTEFRESYHSNYVIPHLAKVLHTTAEVTLLYLLAHTQNDIVNRHKLSLDITLYFITVHVYGILISPPQLNFYVTSKSDVLCPSGCCFINMQASQDNVPINNSCQEVFSTYHLQTRTSNKSRKENLRN